MTVENKKPDEWMNYQTWIVALRLEHDKSINAYWIAVAEEIRLLDKLPQEQMEDPTRMLADRMKVEFGDTIPPELNGVLSELLRAALHGVDWPELARAILAESADVETKVESEGSTGSGSRPTTDLDRKFSLGQVVSTPGALETVAPSDLLTALSRHHRGDWGECCSEDWERNEAALRDGFRLLSVYRSQRGERFWIITEWDRSVTTVLLPSEY